MLATGQNHASSSNTSSVPGGHPRPANMESRLLRWETCGILLWHLPEAEVVAGKRTMKLISCVYVVQTEDMLPLNSYPSLASGAMFVALSRM